MSKPFEDSTRPAQELSARIAEEPSINTIKQVIHKLERIRDTLNSVSKLAGEVGGSVLELLAGLLPSVQSGIDFWEGEPLSDTSPFSSGAGLPGGSALSGSSSAGGGVGPLLAVLTLFAIALLYRVWFWEFYKLPKPDLIPQLPPERPG